MSIRQGDAMATGNIMFRGTARIPILKWSILYRVILITYIRSRVLLSIIMGCGPIRNLLRFIQTTWATRLIHLIKASISSEIRATCLGKPSGNSARLRCTLILTKLIKNLHAWKLIQIWQHLLVGKNQGKVLSWGRLSTVQIQQEIY